MRTLAATVSECSLPREPFLRLIEANRRDQLVTRYDSFEDLLDYCQLSAAPVGELVLHVFGAATPVRIALSDRLCAGLQVIEHLQDVDEDYAGRVYGPGSTIGASVDAGSPDARSLLSEGARDALVGAPLASCCRSPGSRSPASWPEAASRSISCSAAATGPTSRPAPLREGLPGGGGGR